MQFELHHQNFPKNVFNYFENVCKKMTQHIFARVLRETTQKIQIFGKGSKTSQKSVNRFKTNGRRLLLRNIFCFICFLGSILFYFWDQLNLILGCKSFSFLGSNRIYFWVQIAFIYGFNSILLQSSFRFYPLPNFKFFLLHFVSDEKQSRFN